MKRGLCLTLAALALLFCTACGSNERLDALEAQVSSLEDALSQSEAQRVSDAYDFQRQLEALTADGEQVPPLRDDLTLPPPSAPGRSRVSWSSATASPMATATALPISTRTSGGSWAAG